MLFSCKKASPLNSISMYDLTCASVRGRSDLRITSERSDSMYSNTRTIMDPWGNTSRNRATYGLSSMCCSALISLKPKVQNVSWGCVSVGRASQKVRFQYPVWQETYCPKSTFGADSPTVFIQPQCGGFGFFLVCKDFGRMFDNYFPPVLFFLLFSSGD